MVAHVVYRAREQLDSHELGLVGILLSLKDVQVEEVPNGTDVGEVTSIGLNGFVDKILDWQDQFILGVLGDMGARLNSGRNLELFKGEFIDVSGDKLLGSGHGVTD